MPEKLVLSWSGGKDSAMALHALLRDYRYEVVGLLTSVAAECKRISHQAHQVDDLLTQRDRFLGGNATAFVARKRELPIEYLINAVPLR